MPKQNSAILLNKYIWLHRGFGKPGPSTFNIKPYPETLRAQIKEEIAEMHKIYKG